MRRTISPNERIKIAVLVSGGGTNLQALIDAEKAGRMQSGTLSLVISSREDAFALQRAATAGIPSIVIPRKQCASREAFEEQIIKALETYGIELIVLAGFMWILSESFTSRYANRILNIHPSLIPAFCGEGYYGIKVHEAVLAAGVKVSGATVHYVNEVPDGGSILEQKAVRVYPGDSPERLQKRIMRQAEWKILPTAVEKACNKMVTKKRREA